MKNFWKKISKKGSLGLVSAFLAYSLISCGGGSGSDNGNPSTLKTGVLIDSAVSNVSYQTETLSGITNSNGEFSYRDGETVTFSIGLLEFPTVTVV